MCRQILFLENLIGILSKNSTPLYLCGSHSRFFVPDIDLFASRLNFQTKVYVSWSPDPGAWAVDAFLFCWKDFKPYIFLPFSLLGRVLLKLQKAEVFDAIIIAPWWPTAH